MERPAAALRDLAALAQSIAATLTDAADQLERTTNLLPDHAKRIRAKVQAMRRFAEHERQESARLLRLAGRSSCDQRGRRGGGVLGRQC
jgi:type II secretory pathway predicted ATPase ExeA